MHALESSWLLIQTGQKLCAVQATAFLAAKQPSMAKPESSNASLVHAQFGVLRRMALANKIQLPRVLDNYLDSIAHALRYEMVSPDFQHSVRAGDGSAHSPSEHSSAPTPDAGPDCCMRERPVSC